jgi:hypothetical protein
MPHHAVPGRVGHQSVGLICGKVAPSWVAVPLMRGFRHPLIHPAVPACPAGAGVAADAARRAAARIVDTYPVLLLWRICRGRCAGLGRRGNGVKGPLPPIDEGKGPFTPASDGSRRGQGAPDPMTGGVRGDCWFL